VTTGLNALWGAVKHLGGTDAQTSPGPGQFLAEIGPKAL